MYLGGRLRLAADLAQSELALEPLLGSKGAVQLNNDYGIIIHVYNILFTIQRLSTGTATRTIRDTGTVVVESLVGRYYTVFTSYSNAHLIR